MVPFIYNVFISFFSFALFFESKRNFDQLKWTENKQKRFQMANSIIDSKMLINKDTNQVKQLLGNSSLRNDSLKEWNYQMGTGGDGLGFLLHSLIIKFDKNKVTSVQHQKIRD